MSEAERNAQIEREVQQRLAAERRPNEQRGSTQQQADLPTREQALADKEAAATTDRPTAATPRPTQRDRIVDAPARQPRRKIAMAARARSYDTFYRKLEPYGAWRETADYGYVWQPRAGAAIAQLAALHRRPLGLHRCRLDVGFRGAIWLGDLSLRPLDAACAASAGSGFPVTNGRRPGFHGARAINMSAGRRCRRKRVSSARTGIKKWADSYYDIDVGEYVFIPNEEIGSERHRSAPSCRWSATSRS